MLWAGFLKLSLSHWLCFTRCWPQILYQLETQGSWSTVSCTWLYGKRSNGINKSLQYVSMFPKTKGKYIIDTCLDFHLAQRLNYDMFYSLHCIFHYPIFQTQWILGGDSLCNLIWYWKIPIQFRASLQACNEF